MKWRPEVLCECEEVKVELLDVLVNDSVFDNENVGNQNQVVIRQSSKPTPFPEMH